MHDLTISFSINSYHHHSVCPLIVTRVTVSRRARHTVNGKWDVTVTCTFNLRPSTTTTTFHIYYNHFLFNNVLPPRLPQSTTTYKSTTNQYVGPHEMLRIKTTHILSWGERLPSSLSITTSPLLLQHHIYTSI